MTGFSAPASTQGIDFKAVNGHLLLVTPNSVETDINTVHGVTYAVSADVVDLDTGEEFTDVLIFPRVLKSQLRKSLGVRVLGRLTQGVAKAGQSPPWQLAAFSEADGKKAQAYIDGQKPAFTAPDSDAPF